MFDHFGSSEYIFACFGMVTTIDSSLICFSGVTSYIVSSNSRTGTNTKEDNTKREVEGNDQRSVGYRNVKRLLVYEDSRVRREKA